jgi:hypothetical protein
MTALPHEHREWWTARDLWASVSITAIWVSVVVTALAGPSIESSTVGGTSSSVPAAVVVALFATLATWAVARYAFRRPE